MSGIIPFHKVILDPMSDNKTSSGHERQNDADFSSMPGADEDLFEVFLADILSLLGDLGDLDEAIEDGDVSKKEIRERLDRFIAYGGKLFVVARELRQRYDDYEEALEEIALGTQDFMPPLSGISRGMMQRIARDALPEEPALRLRNTYQRMRAMLAQWGLTMRPFAQQGFTGYPDIKAVRNLVEQTDHIMQEDSYAQ